MVHVYYRMIATILERCDLWQSCDLTNPNEFKRTYSYIRKIVIYQNQIALYCKIPPLLNNLPGSETSQCQNAPKWSIQRSQVAVIWTIRVL